MLDMLLAEDPVYAALYREVTEKIDKAQQAVNLVLIDINERLEASDRKLHILRENAAELQDATKVFKSNDGSIYTEHGKRLSDEKAKNIVIPKKASKWETYKSEQGNNAALLRDKKKLTDYKTDTLRYNMASKMVKHGFSLYEVQSILGHTSPTTTTRYSHLESASVSKKVAETLFTK